MADQSAAASPTPESRYVYYDSLNFIPVKDKNEYWAAQILYFNKLIGKPLVEAREAKFYRDLEQGIIDVAAYKEFVDPKTPETNGVKGQGGTADYFKSKWDTCPIYSHLETIQEAELKKVPINIVCKASDEFSMLKQEKDNAQILGMPQMRNYVNGMNKHFGIRPLRGDENPFRFIKQMASAKTTQGKKPKRPRPQPAVDQIEQLKGTIWNDEQLALYNQYIYKDGAEIGMEISIKEFMQAVNKWKIIAAQFIPDIKNFNAHCLQCFTSETTGLPEIAYLDPQYVYTSPFILPDMSDKTFWYVEKDISFGQFVRRFGAGMDAKQLEQIFLKNRVYHQIQTSYGDLTVFQRNAAKIRIGYMEFESQNMDVYSDYVANGNPMFKKMSADDYDYAPSDYGKKKYNAQRIESHYNVWYKFYYQPITLTDGAPMSGTTGFAEQAKYIYDFGLLQDQQREGDDFKYSKDSLRGYKIKRMSFSKIMHIYMDDIIHLWHQFQNDIAQSRPDGVLWAKEIIEAMMEWVDVPGSGKNKQAKTLEYIKMLNQTGSGLVSVVDKDGNPVKVEPFTKTSLNSLDTAAKRLALITSLYQMMTQSLGINAVAEGQTPEARTNLGGINASLAAGSNSRYFLEEALSSTIEGVADWLMYYIKECIDEGEASPRFQNIVDIVGQANSMALEAIKDIPTHRMHLHLENQMTDEFKAAIMKVADSMGAAGVLTPDLVLFLSIIENAKQAYGILALKLQQAKATEAAQAQAQAQQAAQAAEQANDLKIAQINATNRGEYLTHEMMKQWDYKIAQLLEGLKKQTQVQTTQMRGQQQADLTDKKGQQNVEQTIVQHHLDKKLENAENGTMDNSVNAKLIKVELPDGSQGQVPNHRVSDLFRKHPTAKIID